MISFQTFFVWAFKIVVDSWKFSMLLLYILWDYWPIFMISASDEQLQQQLEYTLLKSGCLSRWISKMQSDTLEERYAIKFCFKLGKNATETSGILQTAFQPCCMNWASVFEWHQRFKENWAVWETENSKVEPALLCWSKADLVSHPLWGREVGQICVFVFGCVSVCFFMGWGKYIPAYRETFD